MAKNAIAADELRLLIERIERLDEEIKGLQDDRKDVYGEAKSRGFCAKTMKRIVRERKKTVETRREEEAMFDLYRAALGMLDGTPLGNWAVEKLSKSPDEVTAPQPGPPQDLPSAKQIDDAVDTPPPPPSVEDARRMGAEAARAGQPVTANPFPPRGPLRAAWDEAWCHELGSDGMDIPEALRPSARKPKADQAPSPDEADEEQPVLSVDVDPVFAEARAFVLSTQYVSVSKIQKQFQIGYNRATRIVEELERTGVVSAPADQTGRREVLLDEHGLAK